MACVKWKTGEFYYWASTDVPYRHPVGAVNTGEIRWDCGKQVVASPNEVDKQLEARYKQSQEFVESILAKDDVEKATRDSLDGFIQ